jgi:hypothetical protein
MCVCVYCIVFNECTLGEIMLVRLNREFGAINPIAEPPDDDPAWPDMDLVGAVTHSGGGARGGRGHWVTYIRRNQIWWCIDTQTNNIVPINPFTVQQHLTIDLLLFKK